MPRIMGAAQRQDVWRGRARPPRLRASKPIDCVQYATRLQAGKGCDHCLRIGDAEECGYPKTQGWPRSAANLETLRGWPSANRGGGTSITLR